MKWLKLLRTFKEGGVNFYRNGSLTFVTVTVLTVSLFAISMALLLLYIANMVMIEAQNRVNISVYFKSAVEESRILEVKSKLEEYDEIKYVKYISKDQALEELVSYSTKNETIKKALDEVEENPLNSLLVIGAKSPDQYARITEAVNSSFFSEDVSNINFYDNEENIRRISNVILMTKKAGLIFGAIFVLIGILITFNTIKLTIYSHKQEFEVMRLVGASNLYIRMPFIFEGIFYGLVSGLIVVVLLFGASYLISPLTDGNIPQGNALKVFWGHIWIILGGVFGAGILLGMVSSFIAIRRYLKV
ncbi:MAG: Cell division ABC transporter [Candidatus Moranbacteria bacterium GW2011_GWE1_49_15]|nr:MAG: Cell division ABC transporter [Candidatus Moranbacteria bacterium GW2011_GWE1_49_15]